MRAQVDFPLEQQHRHNAVQHLEVERKHNQLVFGDDSGKGRPAKAAELSGFHLPGGGVFRGGQVNPWGKAPAGDGPLSQPDG